MGGWGKGGAGDGEGCVKCWRGWRRLHAIEERGALGGMHGVNNTIGLLRALRMEPLQEHCYLIKLSQVNCGRRAKPFVPRYQVMARITEFWGAVARVNGGE